MIVAFKSKTPTSANNHIVHCTFCNAQQLLREPSGASGAALVRVLQEFEARIATGAGALLLAVYGGKVSEGIDFPDSLCRLVVCVGVPYQALDTRTRQKRDYQDQQHQADPTLHLK
jgi:chromosome transmission fidelity protein 1